MRRRPSVLLASVVALTAGLLLGASSTRLSTTADERPPLQVALLAGGPDMSPQAPPIPTAAPQMPPKTGRISRSRCSTAAPVG
jgi:hypothetical protein